MTDYEKFLSKKNFPDDAFGFDPIYMNDNLFDFQKHLVTWSVKKGRAAIFADCGLGKSIQELTYAENMVRHTNKPALILTPLAVAIQLEREGEKFGIPCKRIQGKKVHKGINIINYERLHYLDSKDFGSIVCDESSILKHHDGKLRKLITEFVRKIPFRLLATATPAPNDYMELGCTSEALGYMGRAQMLGMFFANGGEDTQTWMLKPHAQKRYWQWVASWARAIRKPSDLGFDDGKFILPPITYEQHVVASSREFTGFLPITAVTLEQQRAERKATIKQRCQKVLELVPKDKPALIWCHLNDEGDYLEKIIPGAVQVAGKHSNEEKEERLNAFSSGQIRILITKPKIGGFGMNWQHCSWMSMFPSHSFESFYQSIRRCWRFGQKNTVKCDIVTSRGESRVLRNMQRKERQAEAMFESLVENMTDAIKRNEKQANKKVELPSWL